MRITVTIGDICVDIDDENSEPQPFDVIESILRRASDSAINTWVELHSIGFEIDDEDELEELEDDTETRINIIEADSDDA